MTNHPLDDAAEHDRASPFPATLTVRGSDLEILAISDVFFELRKAMAKFGPMRSAHEGYAVLLEEVDELWDEVKKNDKLRSKAKMRQEAMQVAAMALRFMIDVCPAKTDPLNLEPKTSFAVPPGIDVGRGTIASFAIPSNERRKEQRRKTPCERANADRRLYLSSGNAHDMRLRPTDRRKAPIGVNGPIDVDFFVQPRPQMPRRPLDRRSGYIRRTRQTWWPGPAKRVETRADRRQGVERRGS